ncbi:threonine synthase [Candidatus Gracilibacteria bacterium]|nr:threonine synthase [Candidatus Gracilibacteria bacterium]MCF7856556.1 threonine synthase [Candidatus Gracilibacteria bacterium]MCF7896845.1 threonine synthase [Candidatus Gracilibacteria bacterium]
MPKLICPACDQRFNLTDNRVVCDCGGLLNLVQPLEKLKKQNLKEIFDSRLGARELPDASGVWRYRELLFPVEKIMSRGEGNTRLYPAPQISVELDVEVLFKHEGENPSGSFKDRGMTAAISAGANIGCRNFVCASTGNTSASLASYCAANDLNGIVIIPEGKIAFGKLSQALAFGAKVLQVEGDFDAAMQLVNELGRRFNPENPSESVYVLNSVNPFRIEGQKTIVLEILQQLAWEAPDWIVLPAGNLGNTSAFGKAISEAFDLGLIDKKPRLAAVQATGANPFFNYFKSGWEKFESVENPETIATAIKIGNPQSFLRAKRSIETTNGIVLEATEDEILDAKATIDAAGIGCEPASACSLAGIRQLVKSGEIKPGQKIVGVLTGHLLKDPDTTVNYHSGRLAVSNAARVNRPQKIEADLDAIFKAIGRE